MLKEFLKEKLITFSEEEYDMELVMFPEVVEHIAKIDRVL